MARLEEVCGCGGLCHRRNRGSWYAPGVCGVGGAVLVLAARER